MAHNASVKTVQYGNTSLLHGAIAGFVGTLPMTIFMLVMHRVLPKWQQYALPPEEITDELEDRADIDKYMDKKQHFGVALVSHFGYGAAMGVLYNFLAKRASLPVPAVLKGAVFGVAVWAWSYLGWLPAMEFSAAATDEPLRRNILMIAAHVVWGSVTALVADFLEHQ